MFNEQLSANLEGTLCKTPGTFLNGQIYGRPEDQETPTSPY